MHFQVTVRYGDGRHRYHIFGLHADDIAEALRSVAGSLPDEVVRTGDLVELRPAVDQDARTYLGDGE